MKRLLIDCTLAFLFSRLLIAVITIFGSGVVVESVPAREGVNYHLSLPLERLPLQAGLARRALSADASWYIRIAENGYHPGPVTQDNPRNWVFFPLYPLLIKAVAWPLESTLLAALLVSNLSFFGSLVILGRLATAVGFSDEERRLALWFLCLAPTSYFFSVPVTESLFLLLLSATFYLLHKGHYLRSGLTMMLLGMTRPTGILLLPAYAFALLERRALLRLPGMLALGLAPLGAVAYMGYLYSHLGEPLAFAINQEAWGRQVVDHGDLSARFLNLLPVPLLLPWNFAVLNFAMLIFGLLAAGYLVLKRRLSWALIIAIPLLIGAHTGTLQSMVRYTLPLFPFYFVLAKWANNQRIALILISSFAATLALMTALYSLHVSGAMA